MKDQFETKIKELVNDFAYEYDPKAWEALSKKLPKGNTGLSALAKLAGVLIIAVGALTFWMLNDSKQQQKPVLAKETKVEKINVNKAVAKTQNTKTEYAVSKPNTVNSTISNQIKNQVAEQSEDTPIVPHILTTNNAAQIAQTEQNSMLRLSANQPTEVQTLYTPEPQQHTSITTSPCKGPKITLDAEAINYEDGTPRIKISADCIGSEITWSANGTLQHKKSRSVELLAFKGQTYTISAQAQLDGCMSIEKIQITANEDYNLLAVNAFNPQSRDERNASFMPYALTIRDIRFELLILDPENGAVVFKTSDAQNAWDGIDMRNGQLVPAQKAYIWKVVLQDPLPNEKTTYTGTIVRI
ncbi:MAG: hypothetical protein RLZZ289_1717 [Bacteroidota bacterium]